MSLFGDFTIQIESVSGNHREGEHGSLDCEALGEPAWTFSFVKECRLGVTSLVTAKAVTGRTIEANQNK